jgi:Transglutaminase-like superfamily
VAVASIGGMPVDLNDAAPGGSSAGVDYTAAGPLTELNSVSPAALAGLSRVSADPMTICQHVHSLVIQPHDAAAAGVHADRLAEKDIRPAAMLVEILMALEPTPLHLPRPAKTRVVGTCRHFAVLSCALLRYRGIAARARCGFATYFKPGLGLDHWIIEYRDDQAGGWIRVDTELLGLSVLEHPEHVLAGAFLTGGEAWSEYRAGRVDASAFGVYGTDNFGPAEIRGNAIRDLAALSKVETLPWDEWGRMADSYRGLTGPEYDELIDEVAAVCLDAAPTTVISLYGRDELSVRAELMR